MALISWEKVCRAKERRGLDVKDLDLMNDALVLKVLWQMAQAQDRQWAAIMQAKYCGHDSVWVVQASPGVTPLWRRMLALRPKLEADYTW